MVGLGFRRGGGGGGGGGFLRRAGGHNDGVSNMHTTPSAVLAFSPVPVRVFV